jgi:hypothetical protein
MQASTEVMEDQDTEWDFMNEVKKYGFDDVFDTIYVVAIVNNALNTYFGVINAVEGNNEYWFEIGHNSALLISRVLVLSDKLSVSYLFAPTKPWIRFHHN